MALFYDDLMQHVDYGKWAAYITKLLQKHDKHPEKLLDIACGTGSLLCELSRKGPAGFGLDYSLNMLKNAGKKLRRTMPGTRFVRANMANPPFKTAFDAVLCIYDSMNYCDTLDMLIRSVNSVMRLLIPGGVFIFDVCTEYNCTKYFNGHYQSGRSGNLFYVRKSFYNRDTAKQVNDFVITHAKSGRVWKERHIQTVFPIDEIYSHLEPLQFSCLEMYKNLSLKPPDSRSERIHFYVEKS